MAIRTCANSQIKTNRTCANSIYLCMYSMMEATKFYVFLAIIGTFCIANVLSIRCYQCSTQTDAKGVDSCGAYKRFNSSEHIAIECNSDESHMPGSFCMKVVQQGPRGFIWDGRWRHVIRRCASVADTGVTGVCNWGVYENGDYWEECYCSHDGCNGSDQNRISKTAVILGVALSVCLAIVTTRN